jgi:hypothetical protein
MMRKIKTKSKYLEVWKIAMGIFLMAAMTSCAGTQNAPATETQKHLKSAGFKVHKADTPEKLEHLSTLPQNRLVPKIRDGVSYYIFADARDCKCLYTGTEKEYQRYLGLGAKKSSTRKESNMREESNADRDLDENWDLWSKWD